MEAFDLAFGAEGDLPPLPRIVAIPRDNDSSSIEAAPEPGDDVVEVQPLFGPGPLRMSPSRRPPSAGRRPASGAEIVTKS